MRALDMIIIACGLALDAFAVAMATAASGRARGQRAAFRISFHFGLFQFLMPVVGWGVASRLQAYVESIDHWLAFALLAAIGVHMVYGALAQEERRFRNDPSRGLSLLALSIATSIDALAVGFSLGVLGSGIWWPTVLIGLMTAGLSLAGIGVGAFLGNRFGRPVEVVGGLTLMGIGFNVVYTHLLS